MKNNISLYYLNTHCDKSSHDLIISYWLWRIPILGQFNVHVSTKEIKINVDVHLRLYNNLMFPSTKGQIDGFYPSFWHHEWSPAKKGDKSMYQMSQWLWLINMSTNYQSLILFLWRWIHSVNFRLHLFI